jgi:NADPH-dependent curcumin reductase CurA
MLSSSAPPGGGALHSFAPATAVGIIKRGVADRGTANMPRQFIYQKAPEGFPTEDCFRLSEAPMPVPDEGEVLVETHFLSIDPYMRRQMGGTRGYVNPLQIGDVMIGRGCGVVVESRHPGFQAGDAVQSEFGWREFVVLKGDGLRKLANDLKPMSLSLGIVGQSGATAMVGLNDIAHLKAGDTVVVSAAAGAVGSAVGQIARLMGCPVFGIAGGPEKCRHVIEDLGFDGCIDYKAGPVEPALAAAVPDGIDVYFDNVGGEILDAVLLHLKAGARIPICGQISQYNVSGDPYRMRNVGKLLDSTAMMHGFRIGNHLARRDAALEQLLGWYRDGKLAYRETVADGFEAAPAAFLNMLAGGNYGKQVVRVKE